MLERARLGTEPENKAGHLVRGAGIGLFVIMAATTSGAICFRSTVSMAAGATLFTRMPFAANSVASDFVGDHAGLSGGIGQQVGRPLFPAIAKAFRL